MIGPGRIPLIDGKGSSEAHTMLTNAVDQAQSGRINVCVIVYLGPDGPGVLVPQHGLDGNQATTLIGACGLARRLLEDSIVRANVQRIMARETGGKPA